MWTNGFNIEVIHTYDSECFIYVAVAREYRQCTFDAELPQLFGDDVRLVSDKLEANRAGC